MFSPFQNTWDLSCSEHLTPGETYEEAVLRGLHEELGLGSSSSTSPSTAPAIFITRVVPSFLQSIKYNDIGVWDQEFVEIWEAHSDAPIQPDGKEVVEVKWVNMQELYEDILDRSSQYAPWLLDSLARYRIAVE